MQRIWWERVPNAMCFLSAIETHLLQEKSIVVQYSNALPWQDYLVYRVQNDIREEDCSKTFKIASGVENPGKYLLEEYCKAEKRALYRPAKSYAGFLAEHDDIVLHGLYIFVDAHTDEEVNRWVEYISEYTKARGKNKEKTAFMIMYHGAHAGITRKGITWLSFDDCITEYDRIVFTTLVSASVKAPPYIKDYLTELASSVIGNDIELCAACVQQWKEFLKSPMHLIESIVSAGRRSDGSSYSFERQEADIHSMIWRSQIRSIYPHIEEYRQEFIRRHRSELMSVLPVESSIGEVCREPEDIELGTLIYLAGSKRLFIRSDEYEKLEKYRDARNCLSHLGILSYDSILSLGI